MKFSNKILSQTITQLCLAAGIDHIVISPGSRNAPLIIGFTEHSSFKNFSIVDERCAAFFALGLAQQLKRPVALVCTSGSALLNYYPAIAEAFYSDIPLVVISADRPSHFIDVGDGQTIRQEQVFENHILFSADCVEGEAFNDYNEEIVNIALQTAFAEQGPVHINAPFSEPLYERVDTLQCEPKLTAIESESETKEIDIALFADKWNKAERKIILVGVLPPNSIEQVCIDVMASDPSVIVLTETTSNLHHESFFPAIDQLIAPLDDKGYEKLRPELLLTFGGMVVSKKIKAFLRRHRANEHWHIDAKKANDTFFMQPYHIKSEPNVFLREFLSKTKKVKSVYNLDWQVIKNHRQNQHFKYEKQVSYSDFMAFSILFQKLPKQINLQLSNSATIRYSQLFDLDPTINVYCNRGTSGIDGSMSTAIGASYASSIPTVFVSGDLSFFYDSNALWNNYIPSTFRIIVINNNGGGIFRILPGAMEADHFQEYFETKHQLTAKHLCKMYDIEYVSANDALSLHTGLSDFYKTSNGPKLLEVFTPSEENDKVLKAYFKFLN
jgi:2-succinyl-5-enolpyruvyl-6-hydroxy-3-cyclohexene-1-carboxylate synthase